MYNVYVKRIFVITEIVHMNVGASSEKEKVKESQSRSVAPPLDIHFRCRVGGASQIWTLLKKNNKISLQAVVIFSH